MVSPDQPGGPGASLQAALAQLASGDMAAIKSAIVAIGELEDPVALTVLEALRERRLRVAATGQVLIASSDGATLREVISGRSASEDLESLGEIAMTNTVRRALRASVARLQIASPDSAVRRRAAAVLAKNGPPAALVEFLRAAHDSESDPATRVNLALALAHHDLSSEDRERRLAAIRSIARAEVRTFKPQLEAMVGRGEGGEYSESDDEIRELALSALSAVERNELAGRIVRDLVYGLSLASVLVLAALGLAITFGLMGVINMAHGEMLMLGAYTTYLVQSEFAGRVPDWYAYYLVAALPAAFGVCFATGAVLERAVIRYLYGRPLETLLATWGLALLLIQSVRSLFGAHNVTVPSPAWLSGGYTLVEGVILPYARVAAIALAALITIFIAALLYRSRLGLHIRAVTENRAMAQAMGIRTARVDTVTFGLGSAVAGLGGVALSQIGNVGPELGQGYIVDSFLVVVVGGVGNLLGTVAAALGLGIVNKLLEPATGAVLGKICVLVVVILFIQRRPKGLFALQGRAGQ